MSRLGVRQGLAFLAILAAMLTGAIGAVLDGSSSYVAAAGAYVVLAVLALLFPAAIAVQVISGQILVGSLLIGQDGAAALMLVPAFAGVVATAELLATVAWLDTPLQGDPGDALSRAGRSALIGGGVFGAVVLVSGLPGPGGLVAVGLASGACILLATQLVRDGVSPASGTPISMGRPMRTDSGNEGGTPSERIPPDERLMGKGAMR